MSREERRAYQRMMKNQERGPALPPAARARAERVAARRARLRPGDRSAWFGLAFWVRSVAIGAVLGLIGFSLQWPQMPFALYVGLAVAVVTVALLVGFRLLQRRAAGLRPVDRPPQ